MADLISRAAAIEQMKSMAGCEACYNYNYVRCRACSWDDAMNIVEELPTIEAIPVEWLRDKMEKMNHAAEPHFAFMYVLREWQKEQEAQDGKA